MENKLFWSGIVWDGTGWEAEDIGGTFKSDLDGTNTVKISDEEVLYDYSLNGYFIKKIEDNENVIFKLYDNNDKEVMVLE